MTPPQSPTDMMATYHRVLTVMTSVILVGATGLALAGRVPLPFLGDIEQPDFIGHTFAVVEAAMLGAAVLFLAPRVPRRQPGQSLEGYWADVGRRALVMWFVLETTASLGAVAFVLSGEISPMLVAVAALVALVRLSPSRFTHT
jgi:hypothetical protein